MGILERASGGERIAVSRQPSRSTSGVARPGGRCVAGTAALAGRAARTAPGFAPASPLLAPSAFLGAFAALPFERQLQEFLADVEHPLQDYPTWLVFRIKERIDDLPRDVRQTLRREPLLPPASAVINSRLARGCARFRGSPDASGVPTGYISHRRAVRARFRESPSPATG